MYEESDKTTDKMVKAFYTLVEEKHFSKITVTELIDIAKVSRTTFYRHYKDIYDMYDKICGAMLQEIFRKLELAFIKDREVNPEEIFNVFSEVIESNNHYIALLSGKNGDRRFFEISLYLAQPYFDVVESLFSEKDFFILKFVFYSCIATYVKSIIDETEFNVKDLEIYCNIAAQTQKVGDCDE